MVPMRTALGLLLTGALLAMLGSAWIELSADQRLSVAATTFVAILILLSVDLRRSDR